MTEKHGPFCLETDRAIYDPVGKMSVKHVTDGFYQEIDSEFDWSQGHVLVQEFSFDQAWPTWEMHPRGDEFVYLLQGDVDLVLLHSGQERVVRLTDAGSFAIVPRGIWHTARPLAPTKLLFFTPGEGTLNLERPPEC